MKKTLAKLLSILMAISLLAAILVGCGTQAPSNESAPAESKQESSNNSSDDQAEPQVISFWYTHKGDEAVVVEEAIAAYNASQSKYIVEGLSVTDKQKIVVAMAGNEAPDLIECSSTNLVSYQASGLLTGLNAYINGDTFTEELAPQAMAALNIGGEQYALPFDQKVIALFYNKDILASIGYTEPPETMDEMYEMAIKATTLDADGNIDILGYPLFPLASARQELIYAFGGRWWSEDGKTLTPDDPGIVDSLKMNVQFREQYGVDKVNAFIATANTNRYTEQDMFFAGKQLFRIDGQWLPSMMEKYNSTTNWGVTLMPTNTGDANNRGASRYESTGVAIPVNAVNKDGAYDFAKWLTSAEADKILCIGNGWLPANTSLYEDPDMLAKPCFDIFIDALQNVPKVNACVIADAAQYTSLIEEHLDYVYSGEMTPEDAMKALAERAASLQ